MQIRKFIYSFVIVGLLIPWLAPVAQAQDVEQKLEEIRQRILKELDEGMVDYESQLQAVLRTRFPEEKQFVTQVVFLVQVKKLPKDLVDSAWLWIRQKRPGTPYPFVYFERILRLQTGKLNLPLPEFDRKIYQRAGRTLNDAGLSESDVVREAEEFLKDRDKR